MMKFLQIAALILLAAGAQPAYSAYWQWSKTASNNAGADPSINWAEGMSPSSINDSARAMMARSAEYRDDISGALNTGGTSTAYTLTTNQGLATVPTDGQLVAFTPNNTNGVGVTLRADGGTIYPLQTSPGVGVPGGTLIAGTPYTAKFSLSNTAWILRDFYGSAYTIPLGGLLFSAMDTPPNSNFAYADGNCISRTTYAAFFAIAGTRFGACDGVTTFGVPDIRGRGVYGLDDMGTAAGAAGRLSASAAGCGSTISFPGSICVNGNESQTLTVAQLPVVTPAGSFSASLSSGNVAIPIRDWVTGGGGSTDPTHVSTGSNLGADAGVLNRSVTGSVSGSIVGTPFGSGSAHPNVPPMMGMKIYVRIF